MTRVVLILLLAAAGAKAQDRSEESNDLWKWVNFGILAVGLGYLVAKTLPPFFRSRTAEIQNGITEAQKIKREAETRASEVEARLASLSEEIDKFQLNARTEMEQEGARLREETSRHLQKLQQQAGQEIETAGKLARRELKAYAAKVALDLAEQRIRTRLDKSTDNGLVEEFVKNLGSRN